MYEVFVNEAPLILTNERPQDSNGNLFSLDGDSIVEAIKLLSKNLKNNKSIVKGTFKAHRVVFISI